MQRRSIFLGFFKGCMSVPESSNAIIVLLYNLCAAYLELYQKVVIGTSGSIEKRQRAGKIMIQAYESERILLRDESKKKFSCLSCIKNEFDIAVNCESDESSEESNLLFGSLELYLSENFWKWIMTENKQHWSNFIKERGNDTTFEYSEAMKEKIYDITGYLCGHRISNVLKYNRLCTDFRYVFHEYYTHSRYDLGSTALGKGMPARYLLFRQHSEGLYFPRVGNYIFIKIIQSIYMQSLTSDVLILFNSDEPVSKVKEVIMNSTNVQNAFKESCVTLQHCFTDSLDLALHKTPIAFLFQFIITGFLRVYSKDIYQLRLSNVLLSKSGASGIRTALLTLSTLSGKNKKNVPIIGAEEQLSNIEGLSASSNSSYICPCGKEYKNNKSGWYRRHITTCAICLSSQLIPLTTKEAQISSVLEGRIELECLEEFEDFDADKDLQEGINLENALEEDENAFDAEYVSNMLQED